MYSIGSNSAWGWDKMAFLVPSNKSYPMRMILYIQNSYRSSRKWINEESAQTSFLTEAKNMEKTIIPKAKRKQRNWRGWTYKNMCFQNQSTYEWPCQKSQARICFSLLQHDVKKPVPWSCAVQGSPGSLLIYSNRQEIQRLNYNYYCTQQC